MALDKNHKFTKKNFSDGIFKTIHQTSVSSFSSWVWWSRLAFRRDRCRGVLHPLPADVAWWVFLFFLARAVCGLRRSWPLCLAHNDERILCRDLSEAACSFSNFQWSRLLHRSYFEFLKTSQLNLSKFSFACSRNCLYLHRWHRVRMHHYFHPFSKSGFLKKRYHLNLLILDWEYLDLMAFL